MEDGYFDECAEMARLSLNMPDLSPYYRLLFSMMYVGACDNWDDAEPLRVQAEQIWIMAYNEARFKDDSAAIAHMSELREMLDLYAQQKREYDQAAAEDEDRDENSDEESSDEDTMRSAAMERMVMGRIAMGTAIQAARPRTKAQMMNSFTALVQTSAVSWEDVGLLGLRTPPVISEDDQVLPCFHKPSTKPELCNHTLCVPQGSSTSL